MFQIQNIQVIGQKLAQRLESGRLIQGAFILFTFSLFFMNFPFRFRDNFLNIINRIFFPYYLYLKSIFPENHLLYYRLTALVLFLSGTIVLFIFWRKIRTINLPGKVVALTGILSSDTYPKALFKAALSTMVLTLAGTTLYYIARFAISDKVVFNAVQFWISYLLILSLIYLAYCLIYTGRNQILPFVKQFFLTPTSAFNLAIFRALIGLYLFGFYHYRTFTTPFWATMPQESRVSLPMMGWFIQNVPINPELYHITGIAGMVLAWFITVGLFTRPALLLNIPLSVYLLGVPMFFGKLAHQQIWVWFPAILAFSRCADVFSLDALIRKYLRKQTLEQTISPLYSLPLKFVWLHFGIIYFFAGIVKLRDCGLDWALGNNMINQIQIEWLQNYNAMPGFRIDRYPLLAHTGGIFLILFELFYPFLILTPLTRLFSFWGGLSFHQSALYFMNIGFQDLQHTYSSYINFSGIGQRVKGWVKGRTPSNLLCTETKTHSFTQNWKQKGFRFTFLTGSFLFIINFFCGLTGIHSWPFSSYPTYSRIVEDQHWYVYFEAYDRNSQSFDLYKLGEQAGHRMESFTPLEDRIYENYQAGDTSAMNQNIQRLWTIWIDNVLELKEADSVVVYLRQSPIAPETKDSIIQQIKLAILSEKDLH